MNESRETSQEWETPELTVLGDLDVLTAAGASGSEDGQAGFTSV